jgi:hypothetical protein
VDTTLKYELGLGLTDPWAARDVMVWGEDKPDANNTGVLSTALYNPSRITQSGDFVVAAGDVEYLNYDFQGRCTVNTTGRKYFRNCKFLGQASPSSEQGLLHLTSANATNVIVEDCDLVPSTPTAYFTGILGHHYVVRRSKFRHVVDGCGVYNTNSGQGAAATGVTIEMNLITDHSWFSTAPNQSDGSHCDCIQLQGGSGTIIRGNTLNAYNDTSVGNSPWSRVGESGHRGTSDLMFTPNVGAITACQILKNWCTGGEIASNAAAAGNAGNNLGTWTSNRFGGDSYGGHTIDFRTGALYTASGNVYDATGLPVTIRVYG